jgi:LL-diaminopimelate aminotransferase
MMAAVAALNPNYLRLRGSYLFTEISRRVRAFQQEHPNARLIRLGIGDVTRPLPAAVRAAMHAAVDEMGDAATFRGYGPEQGYDFLREKIAAHDFGPRGVAVAADEVFVSDGAKSDCGNFQELFDASSVVALTDPVYPVYVDSNVMAGRGGEPTERGYDRLVYLPCTAENDFAPAIPPGPVDLIYLCYPNNPTGATLSRDSLARWVEYARQVRAVILYDAAYEAYIRDPAIPHSIYEIEGAREVAIEFRSFSKTAGFTGTRCAYTIVPREARVFDRDGHGHSLNELWLRRQTTKFNGVPYVVQRGAEAVYSDEGRREVRGLIDDYMANATIIRDGLQAAGLSVYGGRDAPYLWVKAPGGLSSWEFFDLLLNEVHVVSTPGSGFGHSGEGYLRLTAFGRRDECEEAVDRIRRRLNS